MKSLRLLLLVVPLLPAYSRSSSSLDYGYVNDLKANESQNSTLTFEQKSEWSFGEEAQDTRYHLQLRLWTDSERPKLLHRLDRDNVEKLILYGEKPLGNFKVGIGAQELSWGENPLMPILDLVNVRSLNHPRGYYDPAAKIPAAMVNIEWSFQEVSLQAIVVPVPEKMPEPDEVAGFAIAKDKPYKIGRDSEYGLRLGLLTEGVDTRLYYLRHWPRVPSYRFQAFSGATDLELDEVMGETFGSSASYATYSWIMRADIAHHTNYPATNIGTSIERTDLTQSILGLSWTSDSQQTFGTEFHTDYWHRPPVAYSKGAFVKETRGEQSLMWLGLTANLNIGNNLLEPFFVYLHGIQKEDVLMRAIIPWNASDHLSIAAEYQKTHSESNSPKLLLDIRETIAIRSSYTF